MLDAGQLRRVDGLTRQVSAYARYETPADGFLPLMAVETYATPVLPFLVRPISASATGALRTMAVVKLRHAPYDEVAFIAEQRADGWTIVSVTALVDH